jgi:hypothetical protein
VAPENAAGGYNTGHAQVMTMLCTDSAGWGSGPSRRPHKAKILRSNRRPATTRMFQILSVVKGGGYRYCRTDPPHPKQNSNGLYPLHRVLMENKLGRLLAANEDVHHEDEDKANDDPDNLEVLTKSEHGRLHAKTVERIRLQCMCGKDFQLLPSVWRTRMKQNESCEVYCSRSCGTKYSRM